ncbi:RAD55 family ATPase [Haloarchaeobius sp. DFWS5]|uniref:RAD55 family ATPase n=1 Tax=Haloarchaeobius sp. DFWS5 TaxID=3446114 RepID=UPI003EBAA192
MAQAESVFDGASIPPGTNLLVAGPAMTGKRRLMYELLADAGGGTDATALVTTRKSADTVAREYRKIDPDAERLGIVDCVSRQRGFDANQDTADRRYVSNAGDLTGIGIRTSEFMRQFHTDESIEAAGVGLHTSSTVMMYADFRRVFQFLHVLTGRIEATGYTGIFVVDTPTADTSLAMLTQPFDGLIEVRENEGERQLRVKGVEVGPRRWTEF